MKKYFTDEEIQELMKNSYVKKASNKSITYTEEFKEVFSRLYLTGNPPSLILREMGFDPHVLGRKRIDRFVRNVYKYQALGNDFRDRREGRSGRPPGSKGLADKNRDQNADEEKNALMK